MKPNYYWQSSGIQSGNKDHGDAKGYMACEGMCPCTIFVLSALWAFNFMRTRRVEKVWANAQNSAVAKQTWKAHERRRSLRSTASDCNARNCTHALFFFISYNHGISWQKWPMCVRWRMLRWFCHGSPGRSDHLSTGPLPPCHRGMGDQIKSSNLGRFGFTCECSHMIMVFVLW